VAIIVFATLFSIGGAAPGETQAVRFCIVCSEHWLADAISNVLLFLPFGASLSASLSASLGTGRVWQGATAIRAIKQAGAAGLLLSLLVESAQWMGWPPGRSPAVADLLTNTTGAVAGALLAASWPQVVQPVRSVATWCVLAWSIGAASVLALTACALGESTATLGDAPSATQVRASRYSYAPAFGWYDGTIESVQVAAQVFSRPTGTGPVVRALDPVPWSLSTSATLTRLDPAANIRAVLYLHAVRDSLPVLLIGQQRDTAWLIVTRRAGRHGLYMPRLALAGAWGDLQRDARPVTVHAFASGERLRLEAFPSGAATPAAHAELRLTPALGWALLQPAVTVQSPWALLVLCGWLGLLAGPLGWWSAHASRTAVTLGAVLVVGSAVLSPVLGAVHPLRVSEWVMLAGAYVTGALLALHRLRTKRA
jgi:hypothetical protein